MEQKLGAQNEPQGSLLNASDRAEHTGGMGYASKQKKIMPGEKNPPGNGFAG